MIQRSVEPVDIAAAVPQASVSIPALVMEGVSHRYGSLCAVDRVSLSVGRGEIVCLVGPSGCGKSTLLRLAAGLEELQSGTVRIDGKTVAGSGQPVPTERRGVGLVFQDFALFPHLSVLDNVRFGLSALPAAAQRERALAALAQVGMADYAQTYPHALSGGQQQRVALARALAPRPGVLLLDEPFSGLDPRLRHQVRDETLHVLKRSGVATLVVTHDPEEAMFLGDRIVLMRAGHVVQDGTPVDIYLHPADEFAASFFGEVNRLTGRVADGKAETPFGSIGCLQVPEGERVDIVIRPEALRLSRPADDPGATIGRVMAARLLGRTSLVHLQVPDGAGGDVHMHARVPGLFLPPEDSLVGIRLDRRQTFVFRVQEEELQR